MNAIDAHDREYAAAAAYLCEQTISGGTTRLVDGQLRTTYAVGERIAFIENGHTLYGVVVEVLDDDIYHVRRHVPDVGNMHHAVYGDQITPF